MDIRKIETFLCVAQTSSLSEAAKQIHLSQPAVSHQIKMLEEELAVELFIRSNTGLKLTEAGHLLLPYARRLMRDTNDLREMMASLKNNETGDLRIACSSTSGRFVLPLMVARYCTAYPAVRVSILACQPRYMVERLLESEAHLGIVSSEPVEPGLQAQEFFRDAISLVVASSHPWAGRRSIEPSDLLQERVIMREESSGTRKVMLEELAKFDINLEDLNVFLEVGNVEGVLELVADGYGVSFVSELASRTLRLLGRVVCLPITGMTMERVNYLVRKRASPPHRARDVFWGFIHAPENADLLHRNLN
ncbi:MAG: LysR family transcriptional regulator [Anaerolineales bacterium]|jgi:DNA-binding transcriptional LysR family regulator|nr:LysR family transcriptional regulator [Chloroflexota bacterium]MBK6644562.1 LysR family transcriptional regulator [Anaerolineales bacterium]MCC6986159.1 LysR family transcriptional regulator [Anaerolineales bacterium]